MNVAVDALSIRDSQVPMSPSRASLARVVRIDARLRADVAQHADGRAVRDLRRALCRVLVPFKVVPLIPGVTELRPANAIPVVCSFLFGPAAAWGSAIGNMIGDFFGGVSPGDIFGFFANLAYGWIPYKVWELIAARREPGRRSPMVISSSTSSPAWPRACCAPTWSDGPTTCSSSGRSRCSAT